MTVDNQLVSWFRSVDLDENRAKIYITALSLGEASAGELADAVGMKRTAIYDNLRALEDWGLMHMVRRGRQKIFLPLPPKELYKKVDGQRRQLQDLLPNFLAIYGEKKQQPFTQLFDGPGAARAVYEDILEKTKKEYIYFSPPQLTLEMIERPYMEEWVQRRVKKGIHARSLRVRGKSLPDTPIFNEEAKYLRQVRYLPYYLDLKSTIYIYENNVGVISTSEEKVAFIVRSRDLAFSMRQIFEFIWQVSKKS
jgi:sugar-specific transcriptional regulator TrmB